MNKGFRNVFERRRVSDNRASRKDVRGHHAARRGHDSDITLPIDSSAVMHDKVPAIEILRDGHAAQKLSPYGEHDTPER